MKKPGFPEGRSFGNCLWEKGKKFLHEKRIPFDISVTEDDPFYSEENMKHLSRSISRLEDGKGQVHDLLEE